jgi:hypothetical protein
MLVTGYRQVLSWGFLCKFIDFFPVVRHPCSHKWHAGRKLCWRSHHYHLYQALYALSLDACLCPDNLKQMKLPSQACCSLTEICLLFSWAMSIECSQTSWLCVAVASGNATETHGTDICVMVYARLFIICYVHPLLVADEVSGRNMAATQCYPWWTFKVLLWKFLWNS